MGTLSHSYKYTIKIHNVWYAFVRTRKRNFAFSKLMNGRWSLVNVLILAITFIEREEEKLYFSSATSINIGQRYNVMWVMEIMCYIFFSSSSFPFLLKNIYIRIRAPEENEKWRRESGKFMHARQSFAVLWFIFNSERQLRKNVLFMNGNMYREEWFTTRARPYIFSHRIQQVVNTCFIHFRHQDECIRIRLIIIRATKMELYSPVFSNANLRYTFSMSRRAPRSRFCFCFCFFFVRSFALR